MNFTVKSTPSFERMLKPIVKRQKAFFGSLQELVQSLKINPTQGVSIGHGCYKIRLAIPGKGKSGGTRVLTYVVLQDNEVTLLAIYSKNEMENIPPDVLQRLLNEL